MLVARLTLALFALTTFVSGSKNATVEWDSHSLILNGRREMIWSGEYHPFRLPSPGLWLDVFQKIKAMGYSAVSFYLYWALLEGQQGHFRAHGIFAVEPFLEAASQAGIYLIARPGPYINSESSGGGLPGWFQRSTARLRTSDADYLQPALNYTRLVAELIAPYQYTRGGPIIYVQVENEYTAGALDPAYMQALQDTYRAHGINVPLSFNDAFPEGNWAPGTGEGAVQLYGSDGYPFGYGTSCATPYNWPPNALPSNTDNYTLHMLQSPTTPFAIMEFQGGSPVGWGGTSQDLCLAYYGAQWESVFYKDIQANAVKIFNIYMTYGGTNWGGISWPGGITSYDEGSVISEERLVSREKYSAAKLQASFLQASPAYLTSEPNNGQPTGAKVSNSNVLMQTLTDQDSDTTFYVLRQTDYSSTTTVTYNLTLPLANALVNIPQLGGQLSLDGRDSRLMVANYTVGTQNLLYCTSDLFSWAGSGNSTVLVVYGGHGQLHELSFDGSAGRPAVYGKQVKVATKSGMTVVQWQATPQRRVLEFNNGLKVYLLWTNDAYNYWAIDATDNDNEDKIPVIVNAGYLVRNATIQGDTISFMGDVNRTTTVELISAPQGVNKICFNSICGTSPAGKGNSLPKVQVPFKMPKVNLPKLSSLPWKYLDSLPEIQPGYNDSLWVECDRTTTNNAIQSLLTPTSLYSGDYGFHVGPFVYRGTFTANGEETTLSLTTQGGTGFGHSIWLDDEFLASFAGDSNDASWTQTINLPQLTKGTQHTFTVIVDSMGLEMNWFVGGQQMQTPRGIIDYNMTGHAATDLTWRMTGNLGGEEYVDLTRGPLNEAGLYAERQGFHLPGAPISSWKSGSPLKGIAAAGVGFYAATFSLDLPRGYDIPLSFTLPAASSGQSSNYRVRMFVNGYSMLHYVHNLGPQNMFPVPEGVLNHQGQNYIAILLWAQDAAGANLDDLTLTPTAVIQSGYGQIAHAPQSAWSRRPHAY